MEINVTPLSDAPTIPKATTYQGAFLPAKKKSAAFLPLPVKWPIKNNTPTYRHDMSINVVADIAPNLHVRTPSLAFYLYPVQQLPSRLIEAAVDQISTLPGIGRRTALRLALSLLRRDNERVKSFAEAIVAMSEGVTPCDVCHNLTEQITCSICSTPLRNKNVICVVEDIRDLLAIENVGSFRGVYHVLGGIISPMDGVGPSDLNIEALISRLAEINTKEVETSDDKESDSEIEIIFALPATMEGDTTSFYLYKKLASFEVKITTLARGVAVGEALQHADEATLARSMDNRTLYEC
jgi:recombination protein RecR